MTTAVTGHRPNKLGGWNRGIHDALGTFAVSVLSQARPPGVITGMALGWDQAVAVACVRLGIPFVAAVPFEGQESRWGPQQQGDYHKLLLCASQVHIVSGKDVVREVGVSWAMQARNCWMVDNSEKLIALWDGGRTGGTAHCVQYAKEGRREIENAWPLWRQWWDGGLYLV